MITLHERFVIDENGKRSAILLDIEEYNKLLEELESIRHHVLTCPASKSVGYTVGSIPHNTEPQ